jgi:hypothetical protein
MEAYEILNYRGENVFHFKEYKVTDIVGNTLFSDLKGVFFSTTEMNKLYSERDVNLVIFFKESEKNRYFKALKEKIISKLNRKKNDIEKKIQDIEKASLL